MWLDLCGVDCQTHEEALTWRTDETFKMTLQYDNKALWVGLELYGHILLWISLIILILTTGVLIAGKVTCPVTIEKVVRSLHHSFHTLTLF